MKKGLLLVVAILGLTNLFATNATNEKIVNYKYDDAVTFLERGIEFHVFLNGDFDFNRNTIYNNRTYIRKDHFGRIQQIGNTVINYGFNGNVTGIGNIPVRYNFGQLSSVGNLQVQYDRWGYPHYKGFVKQNRFYNNGFNINVNLGTVCNYNDTYFYGSLFRNNYRQFREDANFFYYRAIPNARIGNRNQILKRRKPGKNIVIKSNNRYNNRANTIRYNTPRVNNNNRGNTIRNNTPRVNNNNRGNTVRNNTHRVTNNNRANTVRNNTPRVTNNNRGNTTVRNNTPRVNNNRNTTVRNSNSKRVTTSTKTVKNNRNGNNRTVTKKTVTKISKTPVRTNSKRGNSKRSR